MHAQIILSDGFGRLDAIAPGQRRAVRAGADN